MRDRRGQANVEYILIAILVGLASILVIGKFGGAIRGRYEKASQSVDNASSSAARQAASGQQSSEGSTESAEGGGGGSAEADGGGGSEGASAFQLHFSFGLYGTISLLIVIVLFALLYVSQMKKNIVKSQAKEKALLERRKRFESESGGIDLGGFGGGDEAGQAMTEFFITSLVGIVLILGVFQLTMIYNARSMLKLAAFNAARAAIVARNDATVLSDGAVTMDIMRRRARQAAFVTLMPVIPAIQGRFPTTPNVQQFERLAQTATGTSQGQMLNAMRTALQFGGGTSRINAAVWEFGQNNCPDDNGQLIDCLDVKILPANAPVPALPAQIPVVPWGAQEFDNPNAGPNAGLIKVVLTWYYPVTIPFANRIFTAIGRPGLYTRAANAAFGGNGADQATNPALAVMGTPNGQASVNLWAQGFSFSQVTRTQLGQTPVGANTLAGLFSGTFKVPQPTGGNEGTVMEETRFFAGQNTNTIMLQTLGEFLFFRVPVRASYIMRMQWDRNG